jgi:hypothetical protein
LARWTGLRPPETWWRLGCLQDARAAGSTAARPTFALVEQDLAVFVRAGDWRFFSEAALQAGGIVAAPAS